MRHFFKYGSSQTEYEPCEYCGMTVAQTCADERYVTLCPGKPYSDERGRFCSFNTCCGRNCTPKERDRCQWWEHAKDESLQQPLNLVPPLSHAKDPNGE